MCYTHRHYTCIKHRLIYNKIIRFLDFHAEESATVQPSLSPSHSSNATENVGSLTSDVIEIEKRKQLQGLFSFSINEFICYKN